MPKRRFGHIRKLPSGRWQASYTAPDGYRYLAPHTFSTHTLAANFLRHEEALIETNQWAEQRVSATAYFVDYCEEFINTQITRNGELLKPTTQHLYRTLLRVHLLAFHSMRLDEIDTPTIRKWWSESISDGKRTSRSRAYKLLSAALNQAVRDGLIERNPCTLTGAHSAATGKTIVVPTLEEVKKIIDNINPRYRTFTTVLANSSLRFGEAAALERTDLSMNALNGRPAWEIDVNKTTVIIEGTLCTQTPKTGASIRTIKLKPELTQPLSEHLATHSERNTPLVFPNASDGYIRNDVYRNSFKRALQRAELDHRITPHSLRHFGASEYGRTGANVAELARYLGDSSEQSVMRYLHSTDRGDDLLEGMRFAG